jgi:type II pantothenate kinase
MAGVDVGATLAKLALRDTRGSLRFALHPSHALDEVVRALRRARPKRVGLTGGGAEGLGRLLDGEATRVNEFAAWGTGMAEVLGLPQNPAAERYLVASVGTGTSVLLADGLSVSRIGGTALGGGTVVGLGTQLLGSADFAEIAGLAARGSRREVDLLVSDIYRAGEFPLAADLTASSFAKLAREDRGADAPRPEDLAAALMGLVGENVALICSGLAAAAQVPRILYAGSTLRDNPALCSVIALVTSALGRTPVFPEHGEFAGAVGALCLAASP